MAEASISVDSFSCPVCLDLLKDPVTIPCGHSYCQRCITECWDQEEQKSAYSCPQCRHSFTPRPAVFKNVLFAEVLEKLKETKVQTAVPAGPGDVQCDLCTGSKSKAVKSCLVCLYSYCQTHFERHEEFHPGKRHQVTEATGRLQDMICPKHQKILEVFCRTDQRCICMLCMVDEHRKHDTVSTALQRAEKERGLKDMQKHWRQRIQQREKDLQQLRDAVEFHTRSAQAAVEESESIFAELTRCIERSRSEVIERIRDQEKTAVSRAEELMERLEQEISDLRRRDAELEQLSHTQDHIHFLQTLQSLSVPESPERTELPVTAVSQTSFDYVRETVSKLRKELEDFCKDNIYMISDAVKCVEIIPSPHPKTREEFLQYSFPLTLDLNTVNPLLFLSNGNREISQGDSVYDYPDNPERFDYWEQVLCVKAVCGRSYWEIELSESGSVDVAVSYRNICRKGDHMKRECLFGYNDHSWRLGFSSYSHSCSYTYTHNSIETEIPVTPTSLRIGVYVDPSAGTLSFYSVSDTMTLIHTVQTTFTQPLYPGFRVIYGTIMKLCDLPTLGPILQV